MRLSSILLGLIVVVVFFTPVLSPSDPMLTNTDNQLSPPDARHLLGTDLLGRDILSRLIFGGQRSLLVALFATILATLPAVSLGLLMGFGNRQFDTFLGVILTALLALPSLLFALVIITLLKTGVAQLILATSLPQVAPFALVIRAVVRSVRQENYVDSAIALGATYWQILCQHILPNVKSTIITYSGITFVYCLLNSAALSFLGLGGEPGVPDWGVLLAEGRSAFRVAPWIAASPGIAITITVFALNSLIDHIIDGRNN